MPEPKAPQRSRAAVLGLVLVVLAGVLVYSWWPAASPAPGPSNQSRQQRKPAASAATPGSPPGSVPGSLNVRLDDLKQPPPEPGEDSRNPFRFYVKPPPPPPPKPVVVTPPPAPVLNPGDPGYTPPAPPPPPPIPLKFIGTMEQGKKRVAIFSDGRGLPVYASEGELVMGQYKLVRIGIESVVMEYPDGRGRQTIPMRGQ
jgi:hypothetical protein